MAFVLRKVLPQQPTYSKNILHFEYHKFPKAKCISQNDRRCQNKQDINNVDICASALSTRPWFKVSQTQTCASPFSAKVTQTQGWREGNCVPAGCTSHAQIFAFRIRLHVTRISKYGFRYLDCKLTGNFLVEAAVMLKTKCKQPNLIKLPWCNTAVPSQPAPLPPIKLDPLALQPHGFAIFSVPCPLVVRCIGGLLLLSLVLGFWSNLAPLEVICLFGLSEKSHEYNTLSTIVPCSL